MSFCPETAGCLIDLHLHLDGSLSTDTAKRLAAKQGILLPRDRELQERLQVGDNCRDLNDYLKKFEFPLSLLQTADAIATAVFDLKQRLQQQGVMYAEIRFAPQLHTRQGLTQTEAVEAAIQSSARCDLDSGLILCCMRGQNNTTENLETVRVAKKYLGKGVCAVDLAGAEGIYPNSLFEQEFALAATFGVPYTIHAGEADGPDSVWSALRMGASRIGHGVRATEEPSLMNELARCGVALELCPTSNLHTAVFNDLTEYPLRILMNHGVKVTVNTDNMTVSNTTLRKEWRRLMDTFALTQEEIYTILRNAAEASFADRETKQKMETVLKTVFAIDKTRQSS